MVPSVYEDGTLYNVLPSGNKAPDETGNHNAYDQTRADFTFSRGSNLAATRINSDGLIEKGRENLLLQSNTFDTTWLKVNATRTSGQSGYDGSNDAWLLSATNTFANVYQSISQTGLVTFSVYAKAGTGNWMMMRLNGSANNLIYVDLANQVFGGTSAQYVDGTITDIGSGWRRVSITINQTSYNNAHIYVAADDLDLNTSNETIYIQNAQLEKGLVATDYIETGSTTAQAGILEDMPRINYDANGENGALLLESSRTNLITRSEYFGSYSKSGGLTLTHNYGTSPEGVQNSTRMQVPDSSNYYILTNSVSATAGTYVISVYIKGTSGQKVQLYSDGSAGGSGFTECELTGDWKRFERVVTTTATGQLNPHILFGYGVSPNAQDIEVWGWQCEAGSHVSSYIPTHGAAVTRGADYPTLTLNSDITDSTEGSVLFDFKLKTDDTGQTLNYFTLNTGTTDNIRFGIIDSSGTKGYFRAKKDGTDLFSQTFTISNLTARNKIAFRWGLNDWKLYLNGSAVYTSTSMATFASGDFTKLESGIGGGAYSFYGEVNQITVFPTKLTDSELADLTA